MNTIPIEVAGDIWYNAQYVQEELDKIPVGQGVILDFRAEGPSIHRLGISTVLNKWLASRDQPANTITVTCWSNATEIIGYPRKSCSVPSHFWKLSKSYWVDVPANNADHMFGLFVGRNSISRNVILHHVVTTWPSHFFVSKMRNNQQLTPWATDPRSLEKLDQWCPLDQESIIDWYNNCPVGSIDHKEIRDQFGDPDNHGRVNRSLLDYYNRFEIELVCETYTLGTTFFPTEKTVRPIMAAKPVLIYGPVNFLKELLNMGFKTYNELWSEDYDNVEGPARWDHIKKIISYLTSLEQGRREQLLEHAKSIAMFNRQHLEKLIHGN